MENSTTQNSATQGTTTNQKVENLIFLGDNSMITALFKNPKTVENIYGKLLRQGYKKEDITLAMSEDTRNTYFPNNNDLTSTSDLGNKTLEGMGVGAAVGGSVGALAAAIAALGTSLAIPGLGIIISGPLAASFAGAGAGAAAGGLVGAFIGSGTPDEQAKRLEEGLNRGGIIIGVKANSNEEREELYKQWQELQNKDPFNQAA